MESEISSHDNVFSYIEYIVRFSSNFHDVRKESSSAAIFLFLMSLLRQGRWFHEIVFKNIHSIGHSHYLKTFELLVKKYLINKVCFDYEVSSILFSSNVWYDEFNHVLLYEGHERFGFTVTIFPNLICSVNCTFQIYRQSSGHKGCNR